MNTPRYDVELLTVGYGDRFVKLSTPSIPEPLNSKIGWKGAIFTQQKKGRVREVAFLTLQQQQQ